MRIIIGYIRVSTEDQAASGISLEAHEAQIRSWAASKGYSNLTVYRDEGISGKSTHNRPGIVAAFEHVCRCKGILVVYSISRMSRSVRDAVCIVDDLGRSGASIVSLTESIDTTTPSGRALFGMTAVFSALEREMASERTKSTLAHLKKTGRVYGQVPYGYRRCGDLLESDEHQQEIIRRMGVYRKLGESLRHIAEDLNLDGIPAPNGGKWNHSSVASVLESSKNPPCVGV